LPIVLVSYGYARTPLAEIAPDAIIDRFADLPAALDRLRPAVTVS
jgi:phosphoglycolate phosphatase